MTKPILNYTLTSCLVLLLYFKTYSNSYESYSALIKNAKQELTEDSVIALKTLQKIDWSKVSAADSNFVALASDKLYLLGTHFSSELFDEEVNLLLLKCKEEDQLTNLAKIHTYLADYYLEINQLDSSFQNIEKAIKLYNNNDDSEKIGNLLLTKAIIYYSRDDYIKSIETVFEAVDKFKDSDQNKQMAFAYLQIGSTYLYINYIDKAEEYYQLAGRYFLEMGDSLGHAICNSNLGLIEYERQNYDEAISLLKSAKIEIVKSNRQIMIAFANQALGECYIRKENSDSALHFTLESLSINNAIDYTFGKTKDYYLLAEIKRQVNQIDSSIIYANKSLELLETEGDYEIDHALSMLLADLYNEKGEFEKSNSFLRRRIAVMDSMSLEKDYINQLSQIENQKLKETEYELKISKEAEKLSIEEQEHQANIIFLLIILLTGIFSVTIFFFITSRSNKTLNQKLTKELTKNQSLIQEIHHRVKNNLQIISSMLNMQSNYIQELKMKEILAECRNRIDSMALIHESLYKNEDNVSPSFSDYVKKLIPLLIETYQLDHNKINLEMDLQDFTLPLDESIPCGLIINEIISNSLKHAFPKNHKSGVISIQMKLNGDLVKLELKDNGIGLAEDFEIEKQESFGFLLIHTLVEQLEARIAIKSHDGLALSIEWKSRMRNKIV